MVEKIFVERLDQDAKIPTKAYQGDAGFDIYACEDCEIPSSGKMIIKTGLRFAIPEGYAGFIWDKSGLAAKHSLKTMAGVLDSNYRGELKVVLANLGKEPYKVEKGQKIAQLVIKKVEAPEIVETKIEDETERGGGGFGSSGLS
jgi:dUTP pyrophosphatase